MEGRRFDAFAKLVTVAASSRRGALRAVAAGVGAVLLTRFGVNVTAACRGPGKRCKLKNGKKRKCCGGARCRGNRCRCPAGRTPCRTSCCRQGQICAGGHCVTGAGTCPSDDTEGCNGNPTCNCFATMQGATRCGVPVIGSCGQCSIDDADCAAFGTGAFCSQCPGCCSGGLSFCGVPCPS